MKLVILESPFAAGKGLRGLIGRWRNKRYARACLRDSLMRGESPIASHLLYTQPGVLRDDDPDERRIGIQAGLAWGWNADASVVYVDRGISRGMTEGILQAQKEGRPVEYRSLYPGKAAVIDDEHVFFRPAAPPRRA